MSGVALRLTLLGAFVLAFSSLALADSSASLGLFATADSQAGGSSSGLLDGFFAFMANVGASLQSAFSGGASASNESGRSFGFQMATDAFVAHGVYSDASQGEASSGGDVGLFGGLFASGSGIAGGSTQSDASSSAGSQARGTAVTSGNFFGGFSGSASGATPGSTSGSAGIIGGPAGSDSGAGSATGSAGGSASGSASDSAAGAGESGASATGSAVGSAGGLLGLGFG
ncbi:hypothetical protein HYV43_03365 [Candidatus Micrarchaeota archaeon]|nr:hypothetical protein [Candidatus Micrarchaeota archaeon]